jgi:pilus assembly protein CpaB
MMSALRSKLRVLRALWQRPGVRLGGLALLALGFAGLAAFAAQGYLQGELEQQRALNAPTQHWVEVVVAKRDLGLNEMLDEASAAVRKLPREYSVSGALSPDHFDQFKGQRLAVAVRSGEPVLMHHLHPNQTASLATRVPEGVRAVTILVDEVNSLSGMLQPGDHIDLQASIRPPGVPGLPNPAEITGLLLQDVPVMATGKQARPLAEDPQQQRPFTAITVEVDPHAAQRLIVAQRTGKLTALLRNRNDRQPVTQKPLDIFGLLQMRPAQAAMAPQAEPEVIVGGKGPLKATEPIAATQGSAPNPSPISAMKP